MTTRAILPILFSIRIVPGRVSRKTAYCPRIPGWYRESRGRLLQLSRGYSVGSDVAEVFVALESDIPV